MRVVLTVLICFIALYSIRSLADRLWLYLQHLSPESPWQQRAAMVSRLVRAVATSCLFIVSVILMLQALE
jgi:hypothetical protein